MATPTIYHHRARIAALSRSRTSDDPEYVAARLALRAESLAEHIEQVVAAAPPLTPAQLDRLAGLLRGSAPPGEVPARSTRRSNFAGQVGALDAGGGAA